MNPVFVHDLRNEPGVCSRSEQRSRCLSFEIPHEMFHGLACVSPARRKRSQNVKAWERVSREQSCLQMLVFVTGRPRIQPTQPCQRRARRVRSPSQPDSAAKTSRCGRTYGSRWDQELGVGGRNRGSLFAASTGWLERATEERNLGPRDESTGRSGGAEQIDAAQRCLRDRPSVH